MGHSKAEKSKTHKQIVTLASKKFREKGISGIGLAELMKGAGRTVGGFYKHFDSRDELVAEALGLALERWQRRVDRAAVGGPPVTYDSLIDEYLSQAHRDHPGVGCAVAALAGEIARSGKRTRAVVTERVTGQIELLTSLIQKAGRENPHAARSSAILTYSALVGALSIARAVSDEQLSREILKTVAQLLKSLPDRS